jgi:hypothetical protein
LRTAGREAPRAAARPLPQRLAQDLDVAIGASKEDLDRMFAEVRARAYDVPLGDVPSPSRTAARAKSAVVGKAAERTDAKSHERSAFGSIVSLMHQEVSP